MILEKGTRMAEVYSTWGTFRVVGEYENMEAALLGWKENKCRELR
jgi:hypothetical protein